MLKLENSIRGLSFSRVAFDLTIQGIKNIPWGMAGAVPQGIYYRTQFSYERYVNKDG